MKKYSILILFIVFMVAAVMLISSSGQIEKKPIKIGFSSALTGPVQIPGNWALQGAQLAVESLNAQGGVNGRQVELIVEDDQCNPTEASKTTNKLVNIDRVNKLFIFCSAAIPGTTPFTKEKAVVLYPSVKSVSETNYFTLYPSVELEMEKLASYIINDRDIRTIAEFYQKDAAGEAIKTNFVQAFEGMGGRVVIVEASSNFEDKDFKTSLLKVKQEGVQAILITGAPANFIKSIQQAFELGLKVQFFSNSLGAENMTVVKTLGSLSDGIEFSAPYRTEDAQEFGTFYETYRARYQTDPSIWSAFAYDAIRVFVMLEDRCKDNLDCMQRELVNVKNFEGASGKFSFDDEKTTDRRIYIKRIENGSFKVLKAFDTTD